MTTNGKTTRQTASRRKHERRAAAINAQIGKDYKASTLLAFRQSVMNAKEELVNHVQGRLSRHVGEIPGVELILEHGTLWLESSPEADALRASVNAEAIYGGTSGRRLIGWKFNIEGTIVFFSLFSAAEDNVEGTNDFTNALTDIIIDHAIEHLYTGPFTRLARDEGHGNELIKVGEKTGLVIHGVGFRDINLGSPEGQKEARKRIADAADDWHNVVERLHVGVSNVLAAGGLPSSELNIPGIGYAFREGTPGARKLDHTVVPMADKETIAMVRDFVKWSGQDLTALQIAEQMASKHGWGSRTLRRRLRNDKATVMDARCPDAAIDGLWQFLPTLLTGHYTLDQSIPMDEGLIRWELLQRGTVETVKGNTHLVIDIDFHNELLPGGQWCDPALIQVAIERRLTAKPVSALIGGAASSKPRKPLMSINEWQDAAWQWTLGGSKRDAYHLLRRPLDQAKRADGRRLGWAPFEKHNEAIAGALDAATLHQALAVAVTDALETSGVQWRRTTIRRKAQQVETVTPHQLEAAKQRLSAAEQGSRIAGYTYARAVELAVKDDTGANRAGVDLALSDRNVANQELADARDELVSIQGDYDTQGPITGEVELEVGNIALILAELSETQHSGPANLAKALRGLLIGLTASVSDDQLNVTVETSLRVETDEGIVIVGPVTLTVPNTQRAMKTQRGDILFEVSMRDGLTVEEAAAHVGYTDMAFVRRRLHERLVETGLLASKGLRAALIDCPIPEVRQVLWAELQARENGKAFRAPVGIDPAWAAHVRSVYLDDREWMRAWASDTHHWSRLAIEQVQAAGEKGMLWGTLLEQLVPGSKRNGIDGNRELIVELVNGKGSVGRNKKMARAWAPALRRSENWHRHAERRVWAHDCPFCETSGTLDHVLRVPEVPGGLLCSTCRRVPSLPSVTFPEGYLKRWAGPRGFKTTKSGPVRGTNLAEG